MSEKLSDYDLNRLYTDELEAWFQTLKDRGVAQYHVASLTQYFGLNEGETRQAPISAPNVGKIIKGRPINQSKGYSLLRVLSALYFLDGITLFQIKDFLEKYQIPLAPNDTWELISNRIVREVQQAKEIAAKQTNTPEHQVTNPEVAGGKPNVWLKRVAVLVATFLLVSVIAIVLLSTRDTIQVEAAISCSEAFVETVPAFLPNQGFSQFRMIETDLSSSILGNSVRSIGIGSEALWVGYLPTAAGTDRVSRYSRENEQLSWTHTCLGRELGSGQNVNDFAFVGQKVFIATDGGGIGEFDGVHWNFYTTANGLPSNSIYQLLIMPNGELWAATYEGVARLKSDRWEVVYRARRGELAGNQVIRIFQDAQGNQWFGLGGAGISRRDAQGNWHTYFANDRNFGNVFGIAVDAQGGIWFGTNRSGLRRYFNNTWETIDVAHNAVLSDIIMDVESDKFGRIWIATPSGVAYTADFGQTWETHSTMDTLDIEFGCLACFYNEDHVWFALKDQGMGHVRIPPLNPVVEFVSVPELVHLRPGEKYIFEVEVRVISESFNESDGDSLRSIALQDTFLFGAYPIIPVLGSVPEGQTYLFSNVDNPIEAPNMLGIYTLDWRVWQGRRFASEPVVIKFEVVAN